MDKVFSVLQVIIPIFAAIILGMLAKKKNLLTSDGVRGLQQFVMNIGLPCVIFNSCYCANVGTESLGTMALVIPFMICTTLWAFRVRKDKFPYHNFPQLFCAQETGMLGIPLFIILFGSAHAYRMGILDLAQAVSAYPTIAILSANAGENPTPKAIVKKVLVSPLLIMSILGLALNISGIGRFLNRIGIGSIITESTAFLAQPVSALMIFSVGYNFSLSSGNRKEVFRICAIHFITFALIGLAVQLGLFLIPNVTPETRWAVLLYSLLPASYLAPSLGRTEEDHSVSSSVCSVLTIVTLVVFCIMAAIV